MKNVEKLVEIESLLENFLKKKRNVALPRSSPTSASLSEPMEKVSPITWMDCFPAFRIRSAQHRNCWKKEISRQRNVPLNA